MTEDVYLNLADAGCDEAQIELFMHLDEQEKLRFLDKHRQQLLKQYRNYQKKLDCLDFLIFTLKQQENIYD